MFRASYGDADPKRLTDVKVRLFPVAASGGEAGADDDSQHSEEVLLTWSRDPKTGVLRRVLPLVSADWYVH